MPLPLILGLGTTIASTVGVGTSIYGAVKMKEANDKIKEAEIRHKRNREKLDNQIELTNKAMDDLGRLELKILNGFIDFSNTIEKIQKRPQFKEYSKDGVTLPKCDIEELKKVSVGAGVIIGKLGELAIGTVGRIAAGGITPGMILGPVLGTATLGVGLLANGITFNFTGGKLSDKADEAYSQMIKAEDTINKVCNYLIELENISFNYSKSLTKVYERYLENFNYISYHVNHLNKVDWCEFNKYEKILMENSVLLVGLLYKMCQVSLVNKAENENDMNAINRSNINASIRESEKVLNSIS